MPRRLRDLGRRALCSHGTPGIASAFAALAAPESSSAAECWRLVHAVYQQPQEHPGRDFDELMSNGYTDISVLPSPLATTTDLSFSADTGPGGMSSHRS